MKQCYENHNGLWALLALDYLSKRWALQAFATKVCLSEILCFKLQLNPGISWALLSTYGPWTAKIISIVVGCFLFGFSWYIGKRREEGHCVWGDMMVLVGGTANFIDRLRFGAVIDFIQLSYENWSFPTFNIADIYIVIGVGYMLWDIYQS